MASSTSSAFEAGSFAEDSRAPMTRSRTTCDNSEQRHACVQKPELDKCKCIFRVIGILEPIAPVAVAIYSRAQQKLNGHD